MNEQHEPDVGRIISPFWTAQEAAAYCRVCLRTMNTLCNTQTVKSRKVGNRWLILKRDLDAYLEMGGEVEAKHG